MRQDYIAVLMVVTAVANALLMVRLALEHVCSKSLTYRCLTAAQSLILSVGIFFAGFAMRGV